MEFIPYKANECFEHLYYQIPMELFFNTKYKDKLNSDSKILYGFLLNRLTLSAKNNWIDENGRVYIYFTVEETAEKLGCGIKKAVKLIKDLEVIGLIKKKRTGQGNPTKIYVKDFMSIFRNEELRSIKRENQDLSKGQFKNSDFDNSRMAKKISQDLSKRQPNYIEIS